MPEQIYNADETEVYYKMLPDKLLSVKSDEHCKEGFKAIKERLTLLLAVNATGSHKLKPLCIGKSRSLRCFHHVNMKALLFDYANSKNAWMTDDIFEECFKNKFVPTVRKHLRSLKLPEKALLLLDNCPAYPPAAVLTSRDGQIKVAYLPKNTTSLIQELDQGIIATFKKNYRSELISNIVSGDKSVTELLKLMSLKDFFYFGAAAWRLITARTIKGCWMRGLAPAFSSDNIEEAEQVVGGDSDSDGEEFWGFSSDEVQSIYTGEVDQFRGALASDGITVSTDDINEWLNYDDTSPIADSLTDQDIVAPRLLQRVTIMTMTTASWTMLTAPMLEYRLLPRLLNICSKRFCGLKLRK